MSKQYYEEQAKEFYELKLGTMNMKELMSRIIIRSHNEFTKKLGK